MADIIDRLVAMRDDITDAKNVTEKTSYFRVMLQTRIDIINDAIGTIISLRADVDGLMRRSMQTGPNPLASSLHDPNNPGSN